MTTIARNANVLKSAIAMREAWDASEEEYEGVIYHGDLIYTELRCGTASYDETPDLAALNRAISRVAVLVLTASPVEFAVCCDHGERVCCNCHEVSYESDLVELDGDWYCYDCAHDCGYEYCDECGEWASDTDMVTVRNYWTHNYFDGYEPVYMCEDCARRTAHQCDECGEWYQGLGDCDGEFECADGDGESVYRHLCGECIEDNYGECERCGRLVSARECSAYDGCMCAQCYEEAYCCDLGEYRHTYKTMELRTEFDDRDIRGLLLGIELETESSDNEKTATAVRDAVESFTGNRDACACKRDGSLDDGGCEIVMQPMSPRYALTGIWHKITDAALECGARSHDGGSCGMHVHVSRDYLDSREAVTRLAYLLGNHASEWGTFSRRKRWGYCRLTDAACIRADAKITPRERIDSYFAAANCYGHYTAVNCENSETVEVRIMRGTLKLSTLYATLEAVTALAICAKTMTDEEAVSASWYELVDLMIAELSIHGLRSDELKSYLVSRGLVPEARAIA